MLNLVLSKTIDDKSICHLCKKRKPERRFGFYRVCRQCYQNRVIKPYLNKGKSLIKMLFKKQSAFYFRRRWISFLNRKYYCSFDIRINKCSKCGKNDMHTEIHHYFYLPIMMWACTEELCDACHNKIPVERCIYGRGNKSERVSITNLKRGRPMKHRPLKTLKYALKMNRV